MKVRLTLEQAKSLPNMLGRLTVAMLREYGEYKTIVDGKRIHYILINN